MENLTGKKALIILTNEAFLPRSGHCPRRQSVQNPLLAPNAYANAPLLNANPQAPQKSSPTSPAENAPLVQAPPQAWLPQLVTIQEPPRSYAAFPEASSHASFSSKHAKTGINFYEVAQLWLSLRKQYRMELVFASPRGGPVGADPQSLERMERESSKMNEEIRKENELIVQLGHTIPISWIRPEEFNLAIIVGSQGALFDLPEHEDIGNILADIYRRQGTLIAAIGHGVSALINARQDPRKPSSEYIVKGKRLTCFSRDEERKLGLEECLPFSLEDRLRDRGAKIELKKPFESNVVVEEKIITAQNPASATDFLRAIIQSIQNPSSAVQQPLTSQQQAAYAAMESQPQSQKPVGAASSQIPAQMRR